MSMATSGIDRPHNDYGPQPRGFLTPPASWKKPRCSPVVMPASERRPRRTNQAAKGDLFHVIHKVPSGDSPYVRAKHVQLIDKDPGRAVSLFWSAINSGDRVNSALKDMAVVMKQLDRSDEAIEAIKSFRHLCPPESQESLDNILVELYKQSGRIEEEIAMLQVKLKQVEGGIAFGGKRTKIARSQGKKVQITIEKEYSRLLGNLAWAFMQLKDFKSAEEHYRKALSFEADKNKQCNLAVCLMHMNKMSEAKFLLQTIKVSTDSSGHMDESYAKSYERAMEVMAEMESQKVPKQNNENGLCFQKYCNDKNGVQPSPLHCSIKRTNTGAFTELPYEKRADFDWRTNHNQFNIGQEHCKRPYESPFCSRAIPKVPLTQPPCPRYGNQRKGTESGTSCRKLSFESSTDNGSLRTFAENHSSMTPAEESKVIPQVSERRFPPITGDYWSNYSSDGDDTLRYDKERTISLTYGCQKPAAEGSSFPSDTVFYHDSAKIEEIYNGDSGNCCEFASGMIITLNNANAEETLSQENCGRNPSEISVCNHKKSWADMVEEDEEELESWRGDEFNDENTDYNIITETPKASDQAESLSQKMELMEFGSGYFTQPEKTVRRSLRFDEESNLEIAKTHSTEQLATDVMNFNDHGSVLPEEDFSSTKPMKRMNRLQVFQDITHVYESSSS